MSSPGMKLNHLHKDPTPPVQWLDADFEELSYYRTAAFKAYCLRVLRIVTKAKSRGVNTGEIHRALGDAARPAWTLDAINFLDEVDGYQRGATQAYRLKEWTYAAPMQKKLYQRNQLIPERREVTA